MSIPIVFFHTGNQEYFQKCIELNSIQNNVYIIGDESNINEFNHNPKVTHFNMNNLHIEEISQFTNNFVN